MEDLSAMLADLANSRYLLRAYAASSDSWENFRLTGQQSSLHEVAFALCGAWTLLSDDTDFFDGLKEASAQADRMRAGMAEDENEYKQAAEFQELIADVDKLLARELVVLADAGMDPRHAMRLVTDLGDLLTEGIDVDRLEHDVQMLQHEAHDIAHLLCEAQSRLQAFDYDPVAEAPANRPPHRAWVSGLKTVGKGVAATAGVAGAAGNVAASIASFGLATGLALASVVGGVQGTAIAVRSMRRGD